MPLKWPLKTCPTFSAVDNRAPLIAQPNSDYQRTKEAMSKSAQHSDSRQSDGLQSQTSNDKPARQEPTDRRNLLNRILNTPSLKQVVPKLQPGLLHRVIQTCGLEDCGELVALATPAQLTHIFDLDLWQTARPGLDEQFDAARFGLWIEVLLESGAAIAAQKLAGMDADLVVSGLAQHALVYDRAAVMPYETLDGEWVETSRTDDSGLTSEIGGYLLVAKREDSWEAIVEVLRSLGVGHPEYFYKVMKSCITLSNSGFELDGLDNLEADKDQVMFDVAVDREGRREKQGYVTPAQARAFLQMARQLRPGSDPMPTANPLTRAYFRNLNEEIETDIQSESGLLAVGAEAQSALVDTAGAVAAVFDVLLEAGVIEQAPRALLGEGEAHAPRLGLINAYMQFALDCDPDAYETRNEELVYLANTLMAGCGIQGRSFTAQESSDAAIAVCNLGLENWPSQWFPANATVLPASFLVNHDLISVFQVGWAALHRDVSMYAAEQLIKVLAGLRNHDREIQAGLVALRIELTKCWKAGTPWQVRDALDVITILDMTAWAVLWALFDEFPVLHSSVAASKDIRRRSFKVSDFEFISENSQIALVSEFMQLLPDILRD